MKKIKVEYIFKIVITFFHLKINMKLVLIK